MTGSSPLVSFIVLSYNYCHYIGQTIESILAQTVQDFEIVVIDDCSSDGSVEFVRSFGDPRIVIIENETNLGGAESFNKAFAASRGTFIANVDSDDWIAAVRTERQLALFDAQPELDIVGTYVRFMDADGAVHPKAGDLEPHLNRDWAPNKLESWVVENRLCRSSTMVRRSFHEVFGLYDGDMVYAPDLEVWTRALRYGRRFALVDEALTFYRLHDKGVTHANAYGTLVEIAYVISRNIVPLAHEIGIPTIVSELMEWLLNNHAFPLLDAPQRRALLALVFAHAPIETFRGFREILFGPLRPDLDVAGGNMLALGDAMTTSPMVIRLRQDVEAYMEARDWWHRQADAYRAALEDRAASNPLAPRRLIRQARYAVGWSVRRFKREK